MTADVLDAVLNADPSTPRDQFLWDVLAAVDVDPNFFALPQEELRGDQSILYERIEPPPPAQRRRRISFVEDPNETFREYDPSSRGVRPPMPEPPHRFEDREMTATIVHYPNGAVYMMPPVVADNLLQEVALIQNTADDEHVQIPNIPSPRWDGIPMLSVDYPGDSFRGWFHERNAEAQRYKDAVEKWNDEVRQYWERYPRREGEFETQEEADAQEAELPRRRQLRPRRRTPPPEPSSSSRVLPPSLSRKQNKKRPAPTDDDADEMKDGTSAEGAAAARAAKRPRLVIRLPPAASTRARTPSEAPAAATLAFPDPDGLFSLSPLTPHSSQACSSPPPPPAPPAVPLPTARGKGRARGGAGSASPAKPSRKQATEIRPNPARSNKRKVAAPPPEGVRRSERVKSRALKAAA
ncbi:hypothetical protein BDN70DRAFT_929003 [Pholiota conissans]|uniref:Uncharacterized protein n=1 Tax=Pholiota conissans TaxID=109636 RepID=A0A9P6CY36_9AGAR|nr:hypothetical protein BDN70DRAFT_929003 [Pholiota conissans]